MEKSFVKRNLGSILIKPIGEKCNLNCNYCFCESTQGLKEIGNLSPINDLTLEILIDRVAQDGKDGVTFVWQGGEPLLMGLNFYKKAVDLQKKAGLNCFNNSSPSFSLC